MKAGDKVKINIGPDKGRIGVIKNLLEEEGNTIAYIKIGKFLEQYSTKYLKLIK